MSITYRGEKFSGVNKPKRTPNHPKKSHAVLAKEGDKTRLIRFGQQGVSGAGKSPKTASEKARRKSFKARHAKNIAKGKMSAAYWANKTKWWCVKLAKRMVLGHCHAVVLPRERRTSRHFVPHLGYNIQRHTLMPFKKLKNGKFRSPSGRQLSAKQVRAYYAHKKAKKKK